MSTLHYQTLNEDRTIRNCEYLIRKYAPILMRTGGGSIDQSTGCSKAHNITPEEHDKMIELVKQGKTVKEIAKICNRSTPCVSVHTWKARGCPNARTLTKTKEIKDKIIAMLKKGIKKGKIAKECSCHVATVLKYAKENNLYTNERFFLTNRPVPPKPSWKV